MKKKAALMALIAILTVTGGYAISTTVKTSQDYQLTLTTIRQMQTMVKNFPSEESDKQYEKIKKQFQDATEERYGQNYDSSYEKYKTLKMELLSLLKKISAGYLERTKKILDSTSKDSFDIIVDFSGNSSFASYFHKPFDPLTGVKPYTDKYTSRDYHFFRDK